LKVQGTARGQFSEPELGGDAGFAVVDPLGDELVFIFEGRMGCKRTGPNRGVGRNGIDVCAQIENWRGRDDLGRDADQVAGGVAVVAIIG
jgi:hypothetical protein